MTLLGAIAAVAAAASYGVATVCQAFAARRLSRGSSARVVVQPVYLLGLVLDGAGFLFMVFAAKHLPLFLVQSVVAANVAVTAMLTAAVTRIRASRVDRAAVGVLLLGVSLVAVAARVGGARLLSADQRWGLVFVAAVTAAVAVAARRWVNAGGVDAVTSGLAFAGVSVASRGGAWSLTPALITDATAWLTVAFGLAGMVLYARALQRLPVVMVTAVVSAVETVTAAVAGAVLLGDRTRPGIFAVAAVVGIVLTLAAAMPLCRYAEPAPVSESA